MSDLALANEVDLVADGLTVFGGPARHQVGVLRRSADRIRELTRWQPIETAPKDGRDILLRGGYGTGTYRRVGYWARQVERWSVDAVVPLPEPTHWCRVPEED